ncbi:MAG TPA: hypothetical protein VHW69_12770 [Rhizomicrobium sp.]|nr:hypothetical protein [Rhizomicrobium sp.]
MTGKDIQNDLIARLTPMMADGLIHREWSIRAGADDVFADVDAYAPRLDIALGPFNTTFGRRHEDAEIIRQFRSPLIEQLLNAIIDQNPHFYENNNPRCLVGIEVEYATSSKHILGGITNAGMLGMLGVVVGSPQLIGKVRRIHAYVQNLRQVEKAPGEMFGNVGCFEHEEFLQLLADVG